MKKLVKMQSLAVDADKEKNGAWIAHPDWTGVEFLVASPMNPEFIAARDAAMSGLAKIYGAGIPKEKTEESIGNLYIDHIFKDWRGFDTELTPDLKREIIFDPKWRNIANAVFWAAGEVSRIEAQFVEAEVKNSVKSSATN